MSTKPSVDAVRKRRQRAHKRGKHDASCPPGCQRGPGVTGTPPDTGGDTGGPLAAALAALSEDTADCRRCTARLASAVELVSAGQLTAAGVTAIGGVLTAVEQCDHRALLRVVPGAQDQTAVNLQTYAALRAERQAMGIE